ncbi:HET-domain-containing protein [Daldinia vernicosa]|uniref:HET-domain-containing protein n=1 Tax=Daldinia vernicosa TaxID=114800 RepID=UPI0020081CEC|nr:HET-domain-containing protein [Daldinia vernicosa]KAI0848327.1 HET-domain-containing protein [Daldinia vernicosa]
MSANSPVGPYKPKRRKSKSPYIQQEKISSIACYDAEGNKDYEPPNQPHRKPAYPYRKLEGTDIRLLRILPGTGAIECLLYQIPLEEVEHPKELSWPGERPPFNALSYVWGDTTDKMTIFLEDEPFQVTKNLFRALLQFRELELPDDVIFTDEYFWIDAICINQEDVEERSQQVRRMPEIYGSGQTIVWLGPVNRTLQINPRKKSLQNAGSPKFQISYDEAIEILFEKVRSMGKEWEPADDNYNLIISINEIFGRAYRAVMIVLEDILSRPWWVRLWTIQEARLHMSPLVFVGHHNVRLEKLTTFYSYFVEENKSLVISPGSRRIETLTTIDILYICGEPRTLGLGEVFDRILTAADIKESTDPRDQVYGLLGILKNLKEEEELPDELLPNYHLSYSETYWAYAAFLFQSAGDLKLLECDLNELQGVPSWVTDFRYLRRGPPVPGPSVYVSPDKRTLHLQGCILGTFRSVLNRIDAKAEGPCRERIPVEVTNYAKAFEEHILGPSASIRGITIKEALNDMIEWVNEIIPLESPELLYEAYSNLRDSPRRRRSRTAKKKWTKKTGMLENSVVVNFVHPSLLLHDGSILNAYRRDIEVIAGDLICLFKGANKPSILRASGENFTFLGQCILGGGPLKSKINDDSFWASAHIQDIKLI